VNQAISSDKFLAGGLAFTVHLLLFAVLVLGVSWKRLPDVPVYADMWRDLPAPVPIPPRTKPVARPVAKTEPTAKADIAMRAKAVRQHEAELKLEEAKKRQEDDKRRQLAEEMKRLEQARLSQEAQQLRQRQEQERQAAEQKRQAQDKARKNIDALLAAQTSQELNRESQDIRKQAGDSARVKLLADYMSRIQQKIRGELRLPGNLQGNPEAVYRVDMLPNGEVVRVTQARSSRQPAYDQEVERAIWKANPLPLPPDRDLAAEFRTGLELHFRPHDR